MNSPASPVTARTTRRPRSIGHVGDHPPVGVLMVLWLWGLMALVPREGVGCQKSMVPATSWSGWPWIGLTMRRRLLAFLCWGACVLVVRVSGVGPCP